MFCDRYGFSIVDSAGCTRKRCTNAGTATPPTTDTTAHSPTAIAGSTHPRRQMLTRNSTQANTEINSRRSIAFNCDVGVGVERAVDRAPVGEHELEPAEPVLAGLDEREHRQQHRGVHLDPRLNRSAKWVPSGTWTWIPPLK